MGNNFKTETENVSIILFLQFPINILINKFSVKNVVDILNDKCSRFFLVSVKPIFGWD